MKKAVEGLQTGEGGGRTLSHSSARTCLGPQASLRGLSAKSHPVGPVVRCPCTADARREGLSINTWEHVPGPVPKPCSNSRFGLYWPGGQKCSLDVITHLTAAPLAFERPHLNPQVTADGLGARPPTSRKTPPQGLLPRRVPPTRPLAPGALALGQVPGAGPTVRSCAERLDTGPPPSTWGPGRA